uniref:Putative secreted protein n=1 Tax=Ixodes ricinus TaxID=34613 RepID=A0A6B0UNB5_IXORI
MQGMACSHFVIASWAFLSGYLSGCEAKAHMQTIIVSTLAKMRSAQVAFSYEGVISVPELAGLSLLLIAMKYEHLRAARDSGCACYGHKPRVDYSSKYGKLLCKVFFFLFKKRGIPELNCF